LPLTAQGGVEQGIRIGTAGALRPVVEKKERRDGYEGPRRFPLKHLTQSGGWGKKNLPTTIAGKEEKSPGKERTPKRWWEERWAGFYKVRKASRRFRAEL